VGIVNEQSEHLSNAQIENYGKGTSVEAADGEQRGENQWVESHLDGCSICRGQVLDFQRAHLGLLIDPKFVISEGADSKVADSKDPDRKLANGRFADSKQAAPKLAHAKFLNPKQLTDRPLNTASTPDCPSADDLRQLAAGLLPDAVAEKLTRHAATCDHCGPLLQVYTEDFADDFSPEEQAVMAKLQSSSVQWQKKTAREMIRAANAVSIPDVSSSEIAGAAPSLPKKSSADGARKPFFWKWALIPGYAAVTAAICLIVSLGTVGIWYARRDTPEKVEKLLAQAYTEKRPMEFRWPGAEWGPVRVTRGAGNSALSGSSSLYEAEQILAEKHAANSSNANWLRVKAEAELLDGQSPQTPIADLNQALAMAPSSISLNLLLGIAYAQEGNISEDRGSREKALELFSKVLQLEPANPSALFNRALVYEKLGMKDQSIADLNALRQNEKDSGWAYEAKMKLDESNNKK
jgi:tetratricopeptide (TPR) repeat protein